MKIVAFIPYWLDYQINEIGHHKNLKKIGGKYAINYSIDLLNSIQAVSEVIIYCSDNKVTNFIDKGLNYKLLKREKRLDNKDTSIDDITKSFVNEVDADIYILLHPNSPFISSKTLADCLSHVLSKDFDSAFTAYEFKKLSWFQGCPLNYNLNETIPKLEDLEPVIVEQSSLYVFTKESFAAKSKRVGHKPYIKSINHLEGLEVGTEEDFEIAELIVNSGMYPKD